MSLPDPNYLIVRLAPQEIDKLASVLYEGLGQGAQEIIDRDLKNPEAAHKVFFDAVSEQLASIEKDLSIKDLAKKFNVNQFLDQALS